MSYYWFNKKELLQKAKGKYDNGGKEKAAEYYQANKRTIKKKQRTGIKTCQKKKKKKRCNIPKMDKTN